MFLPAVAQAKTILHLHSMMLPKQSERSICKLENPAGMIGLGFIREYALTSHILTGAPNTEQTCLKVDILSLKSEQLTAPQPGIQQERNHTTHILGFILQQLKQVCNLLKRQVLRFLSFPFWWCDAFTGVGKNYLPLDGGRKHRRNKAMVVLKSVPGQAGLLLGSFEQSIDRLMQCCRKERCIFVSESGTVDYFGGASARPAAEFVYSHCRQTSPFYEFLQFGFGMV